MNENEQWLTEGNCQLCRRNGYCRKESNPCRPRKKILTKREVKKLLDMGFTVEQLGLDVTKVAKLMGIYDPEEKTEADANVNADANADADADVE